MPNGTCYFEDFGTGKDGDVVSGRRLPPTQPGRNQLAICIIKSESWRASLTADAATASGGGLRTDVLTSLNTEWNRNTLQKEQDARHSCYVA